MCDYVVVNVVTPLKLYPRHGSTPDLQGLARDVVDARHQAAGIIWSSLACEATYCTHPCLIFFLSHSLFLVQSLSLSDLAILLKAQDSSSTASPILGTLPALLTSPTVFFV